MGAKRMGVWMVRAAFVVWVMLVWSVGSVSAQKFYQCEEGETPQVKVWAAETQEEADFLAFFVYDSSELGKDGVVMQVPTAAEADFTLSFVDDKEEAMFSLWIVDSPDQAGWQHPEKAAVLEPYIKKK